MPYPPSKTQLEAMHTSIYNLWPFGGGPRLPSARLPAAATTPPDGTPGTTVGTTPEADPKCPLLPIAPIAKTAAPGSAPGASPGSPSLAVLAPAATFTTAIPGSTLESDPESPLLPALAPTAAAALLPGSTPEANPSTPPPPTRLDTPPPSPSPDGVGSVYSTPLPSPRDRRQEETERFSLAIGRIRDHLDTDSKPFSLAAADPDTASIHASIAALMRRTRELESIKDIAQQAVGTAERGAKKYTDLLHAYDDLKRGIENRDRIIARLRKESDTLRATVNQARAEVEERDLRLVAVEGDPDKLPRGAVAVMAERSADDVLALLRAEIPDRASQIEVLRPAARRLILAHLPAVALGTKAAAPPTPQFDDSSGSVPRAADDGLATALRRERDGLMRILLAREGEWLRAKVACRQLPLLLAEVAELKERRRWPS